jgi:CSLREA domain-containing protein
MITSTQNRETIGKVLALAVLVAALAASLMLAAKPSHAATTFTVNSTADHADANLGVGACDTGYDVAGAGGVQVDECTLRAAINQANYTPGADAINFAIPGSGVKTIAPESALPTIVEAVSINGYSQPGAQPNSRAVGSDAVLKIELNGAGVPDGDGLVIEASNSTVRGLVVNRSSNSGIVISRSGATGNRVVGNYLGTDASGTQDLGNYYGVWVYGAPNNTIGGTNAAERNLISGNTINGINIHAANNQVRGNLIGTDKDGTAALGNGEEGVSILGSSSTVAANTIAFNGKDGVAVHLDARDNRVLFNSVHDNAEGGIDLRTLVDDGPTANDPGDADTGPNGLQDKPVLSSAKTSATSTTVRGKLNSTPNKTFKIQFFSNPSGTEEGKKFLGQKSVSTDASGNATFSFSPAQKVGVQRTVTATTTNPAGSTSEFSAPRTVASS